MTEDLKLKPGAVVERYTVEGPLGKGGVAWVYLVRHNSLGSLHALKVLRLQAATMRERMVQEGQLQASLRHPNIVALTDVVDVDGSPGLVMDYIEGLSLDHWLKENRPDVATAEAIFRGILAGVAKAHRLGLVHRDLKPGNVMMAHDDEGNIVPKVTDFGLAKMVSTDVDNSLTQTGTTMGTPAYMAPEQVRDSRSVDQRADIFALGCILYELCTGVSPFYHADLFAIFNALASGSYTPPLSLLPDLPPRINNAISGCLTVHPDNRIDSCSVLQQVLDGELAEDWSSHTFIAPEGMGGPAPRSRRGLRVLGGLTMAATAGLGAAAVVIILLLTAGLVWMNMEGPGDEVAEAPGLVEPERPDGPVPDAPGSVPDVPVLVPVLVPEGVPPGVPVAPSPAPTPELPNPAPAQTGTVTATGDADEVWLDGPGGRVELGAVPAGDYRILASFKGAAPMPAGLVTVRGGRSVTLECSGAFQICKPK